ncbi:dienelactone hydrolase family protein [Pseudonocardia nantongensis]|uniref:dienelactone hydrolase family protein n=1 Tax=Pseudonocardia nantongensis TaxID=1181885 RepID=UPI00397D95C6
MRTSICPRRSDRLHAVVTSKTAWLVVVAVLVAGGGFAPQGDVANRSGGGVVTASGESVFGDSGSAFRETASGSSAENDSVGPTISIDGAAYPDPLRFTNGGPVGSPEMWESTRRGELLAQFREHVYGQSLPEPTEQTFDVAPAEVGGVTRKTVTINVTGPEGSGSFPLKLFVPKTGAKPRGTFLMIDHRGSVPDDPGGSSDYAPVSKITDAGYAFASLDAEQIAPDDSESYRSKMIDLFHPSDQELPDDAGRTISAWAWGASRAMDYLQTDPDIDPEKVAVIGHSRGGKASLWAGAQDTRFAAVITNNSGSTGTKPARRGDGGVGAETVERVNSSFPHWFPQTYKEYGDDVSSLPVDQHQLLGLVAPRRVVVGSAAGDTNADPEGEFLSYVAASRVYELYGLGGTGLPSPKWKPTTDTAFRGPAMSYHLRSGEHGLKSQDWDTYLNGDLFSR